MVKNQKSRIGKAIRDSKLRKQFNLRQKDRNKRKAEQEQIGSNKYVDRKALKQKKLEEKRLRKKGVQSEEQQTSPNESDEEMSSSSLSSHESIVVEQTEPKGEFYQLETYLKATGKEMCKCDKIVVLSECLNHKSIEHTLIAC